MEKRGNLWEKIEKQTRNALQCGALQPIPTEFEWVDQAGMRFLVRVSQNLVRKEAAASQRNLKKVVKEKATKESNPFLPYDQNLFVADLSPTHVCLLNKFNVVDHHLLMVTREFEAQENLLTLPDFEAMWLCLAEVDGLVFYNGGPQAGASQPHKHLQLVPFPLVDTGVKLPIESEIAAVQYQGITATVPQFPFLHRIVRLDPAWATVTVDAAAATLEYYQILLQTLGIKGEQGMSGQQSAPYNLLATREWMMIILRTQEQFENIPVNALGFAGTLFVRSHEQLQTLRNLTPLTILQNVGVTAGGV
ncbi:MAG: phosphorylase [Oscillatoriales cyanobacterium SM2_3_0]|nr:phosphorylase [Oscillatoriales cyanobacterium SM2_3_0]